MGSSPFHPPLQGLIHENHGHLVTLGVSHPFLEAIKSTTAAEPYKLSTKLTGAGGGGCAVTLVPDGEHAVFHSPGNRSQTPSSIIRF